MQKVNERLHSHSHCFESIHLQSPGNENVSLTQKVVHESRSIVQQFTQGTMTYHDFRTFLETFHQVLPSSLGIRSSIFAPLPSPYHPWFPGCPVPWGVEVARGRRGQGGWGQNFRLLQPERRNQKGTPQKVTIITKCRSML